MVRVFADIEQEIRTLGRAEIYGATRQIYMALLAQAAVLLVSFCFIVLLLRRFTW